MRTSTKCIIAGFVALIISMLIYDQQLHSAFVKGTYKIPFSNYTASPISGFRNINLKSASTINIKIEKGPYRILIEPSANDYAKLKVNGDTLEIETIFPDQYHGTSSDFSMYISCPELFSVSSNAYYHMRSREYLDRYASENFQFRRTTISGFTQDSLNVTATNASNIWLLNNNIKNLQAIIGMDSASASNFYIGENNHFAQTHIVVRNFGRFYIGDADSGQSFHYTLTDSAQLIISGRAKHILKTLP